MKALAGLGLVMRVALTTTATGKDRADASNTIIVGTAIATAITETTIATATSA
jgi:hypothetical protein